MVKTGLYRGSKEDLDKIARNSILKPTYEVASFEEAWKLIWSLEGAEGGEKGFGKL